MSDIKMNRPSTHWEVEVRWRLVQHAPMVTDPETGRQVDPHGLDLTFAWFDDAWKLTFVEVHGAVVLPDGTYPNDGDMVCEFYDPTPGEPEKDGGHPVWVAPIAEEVIPQLPVMPEMRIITSYGNVDQAPIEPIDGPMVSRMKNEGLL